jgi:hypothetical protein
MGWVARKFDNLGSAFSGGAGGMGLSQGPAFTHAYLQRLGGHIDEARRTVTLIERGDLLPRLGPVERQEAVAEFSSRVQDLEQAYAAIANASPMMQPVVMLQHSDSDIARRAWETFSPAIPVDAASLVYTGIGVVLALLIYELIKSPAGLFRRRKPERHFSR